MTIVKNYNELKGELEKFIGVGKFLLECDDDLTITLESGEIHNADNFPELQGFTKWLEAKGDRLIISYSENFS